MSCFFFLAVGTVTTLSMMFSSALQRHNEFTARHRRPSEPVVQQDFWHPFLDCKHLLLVSDLAKSHLGPDRQLLRDVPTSNMEPRSPTSKFNVRCSNIEFRNVRSSGSNIEVRSPTSMFDPPLPLPAITSHPLSCLIFFRFFSSFPFFCFFPRPISKPDFDAPTSNFEVGTLKSGFKVQTWNLEHLWELHGRAHPPKSVLKLVHLVCERLQDVVNPSAAYAEFLSDLFLWSYLRTIAYHASNPVLSSAGTVLSGSLDVVLCRTWYELFS